MPICDLKNQNSKKSGIGDIFNLKRWYTKNIHNGETVDTFPVRLLSKQGCLW